MRASIYSAAQALLSGKDLVDEKPRYVIRWAADALKPQPDTEWFVSPLFAAQSVSLIVGEGGSGKTYAALDCAVCVALGGRWLDFDTQQVPVLIIDEESGPRRLAIRLGEVLRGHHGDDDTPLAYVSLARFNIFSPGDVVEIGKIIEETGARFVVIDALADVAIGADENSAGDMQPGIMALRDIAEEQNVHVLVIHHANKAGGYRGTTALKGGVDLMLMVENDGSGLLTFKTEKARDIAPVKFAGYMRFQEGLFDLQPAVEAEGLPTFPKSERYVLRYLRDHGPALVGDITGHADVCTPGTARNALYRITDRGYAERIDDGTQGQAALYNLTAEGEDAAVHL
jgi:DNA-binding MarR family transcriptional regulator